MSEAGQNQDSPRPVPKVVESDDIDVVLTDELDPLIADGVCRGRTIKIARPVPMYGGHKLVLGWQLTEGPYEGIVLYRYYNVKFDGVHVGGQPKSNYLREWIWANGNKPPRLDRMSPRVFERGEFIVRVGTVSRDRDKDPLPPAARYSVIRKVLRRYEGD